MLQTFFPYVSYACAALVGWALWMLLRSFVTKHPLDNIPGPADTESFITGDMVRLWDRVRGWEFNKFMMETYGSVAHLHGPFGARMLYTYDPKALQGIFRRQAVYTHPEWITSANTMILGRGLLSTEGEQHRKQRKLLNPVFTQENVNSMLPIMNSVSHRLRDGMLAQLKDAPKEINVMHWAGRAAFEMMALGGLERSFDPLVSQPEEDSRVFIEALKELIPALFPINHWRLVAPLVETLVPPTMRTFLARLLPHRQFQSLRVICDTMYDTGMAIFRDKKEAIIQEGDEGKQQLRENKDMLSALLKSSLESDKGTRLPEEELIAQMGTMLFAATDTTSSLISRALHALSLHPEMQKKSRSETLEAMTEHGQDLPCDVLANLPLLDAITRETLRLYPAVNILPRVAQKDDCLSLSEPIRGKDGTLISEVFIPKGTTVIIAFLSSNTNKALWGDDAHEWRPERWLEPLPQALIDAQIPGLFANTMSFGAGKHSCIGYRFALMAMKVMLSRLIVNFRFSLPDRKIMWNFSGVNYPSMDRDDVKPSLFLRVENITRGTQL